MSASQIKVSQFVHTLVNYGRPNQVLELDTRDGGLLQSIFQQANTKTEPLIVVPIDCPELPPEFTKEALIAKSTAYLKTIDFGMTKDEKERSRTVTIMDDDDNDLKINVTPSQLVLSADFNPEFIVLAGNRRLLHFQTKLLTMGVDDLLNVQIMGFNEAREEARRENIIKQIGVKALGIKDVFSIVHEGIESGSIRRECDIKKQLNITSRNVSQRVYGAAVKAKQIKSFHSEIMADNMDCGDKGRIALANMPHQLGSELLKCNKKSELVAVLEKGVKDAAETKTKALSGTIIKSLADNASETLRALLNAIVNGDEGEAYMNVQKLNDLESDLMEG